MSSRSLKSNVVANGAGGMVLLAGQLVALPLAVFAAGAEAYGSWLSLLAVAQVLALFDFGMAPAVVRMVAKLSRDDSEANSKSLAAITSTGLWMNVAFAAGAVVAMGAVAWFAGPFLRSPSLSGAEYLYLALFASVLAVPVPLIGRHFQAINQGMQRYDVERLHQVTALIVRVVGLLILVSLDASIVHVALLEALAICLPGLLSAIRIRRYAPFFSASPRNFQVGTRRELLQFGIPWFWLANLTNIVAFLPTFLAGVLAGPVLATAVGAGVRIGQALRQMQAWMLDPLLPNAVGLTDGKRQEVQGKITLALSLFASSVIVGIICTADLFVPIWIGDTPATSAAVHFVQAFAATALVATGHLGFGIIMQARGEPAFFRSETWLWAVTSMGLFSVALLIDPAYGPLAVVVAAVVSEVFFMVKTLRRMSRASSSLHLKVLGFTCFIAVFCIAALAASRMSAQGLGVVPEFFISATAYSLIYGVLVFAISKFFPAALSGLTRKDHS